MRTTFTLTIWRGSGGVALLSHWDEQRHCCAEAWFLNSDAGECRSDGCRVVKGGDMDCVPRQVAEGWLDAWAQDSQPPGPRITEGQPWTFESHMHDSLRVHLARLDRAFAGLLERLRGARTPGLGQLCRKAEALAKLILPLDG